MEYKKLKKDLIYSSIFIAFCIFMIFYAIPTQISINMLIGTDNSGVTSRTLPYICSITILILSVIQFGMSLAKFLKIAKTTPDEDKKFNVKWRIELYALLIYGLYIVYAIAMDTIGFLAASLIVPLIVLFALKDRNIKHYIAIAILAAGMFFLARYGLNIILP